MRKTAFLISALVSTLLAGNAMAQVKPETAIKYRQSVYKVMNWNFGPMAAMVKGEMPYNKDDFAHRAAIVEQMSKLLLEGYTVGSETGETRAKPEIWTKMDDFKAKMEKMQGEVSKLAAVSKAGNFDDIKKQMGAAAGACKACHDEYRNK